MEISNEREDEDARERQRADLPAVAYCGRLDHRRHEASLMHAFGRRWSIPVSSRMLLHDVMSKRVFDPDADLFIARYDEERWPLYEVSLK